MDGVTTLWPSGIQQGEAELDAGKEHAITEVDRQPSSCPMLYGWDFCQAQRLEMIFALTSKKSVGIRSLPIKSGILLGLFSRVLLTMNMTRQLPTAKLTKKYSTHSMNL